MMPPAMLTTSGGSSACLEATSFEQVYPLGAPFGATWLMATLKDLTGQRFGRLIVVERGENYRTLARWVCRCDCGNERLVAGSSLREGKTKSCGCAALEGIGTRFTAGERVGRWTILQYIGKARWSCVCDCGTLRDVATGELSRGDSKSCGCLTRSSIGQRSLKDRTGERFGRLTALELMPKEGKKRRWKCICDCGNTVIVAAGSLGLNTNSCGCIRDEKQAERVGPNHPAWNAALTEEDRLDRRRIEGMWQWRRSVFERDGYTCQVCGVRGGRLHAHHLNGWHWCKEQRLLLSNGVTLCQTHHREFHRIYGKDCVTAEQFSEYQNANKLKKAEALEQADGA